jgi:hypothetical protein
MIDEHAIHFPAVVLSSDSDTLDFISGQETTTTTTLLPLLLSIMSKNGLCHCNGHTMSCELFDLFLIMAQMSKNILLYSCCGITSFAATVDADSSLMGVIPWFCNIVEANVTAAKQVKLVFHRVEKKLALKL